MKKINLQDYNLFDYLAELNSKELNAEQSVVSAPIAKEIKIVDSQNLCPYIILTIDEIIKQIDNLGYDIDKSKLISDTFECGAIAISNAVDFTKFDEREERYKQIMQTYKPKE